jgi:hypothetical protein
MNDIKITHNQFIGIYENVLSKEECKKIIELFESDLKNKVTMPGDKQFFRDKMERHDFSKGYSSDKLDNKIVETVNQALEKSIMLYSDEFWIVRQLKATSTEIKIQKTPPRGGYHVWHCEQDSPKQAQNRVLVWTVYLNDIPNGEGETEFLWQGLRVKPKAGTVSIFPASFTHTHRGNPVYSCDKYIATGWYTLYE